MGLEKLLDSCRKLAITPRVMVVSTPLRGQSAAHHSHDHVLDIADVHHDRHQDAGVGVGFVRAVEHFVVDPVKAVLGLLLMAEDLDHFLTVDHLLDITVEGAQGALLAEGNSGRCGRPGTVSPPGRSRRTPGPQP